MKNLFRLFFCFSICLLLASTAFAQRRHRHRVSSISWGAAQVFSDLYIEPETGDQGGMEVVITQSYGGTWAMVMIGDSVVEDPVLVRVTGDGTNIEFTLPDTPPYNGYGKFTGKISRRGLTLLNNGQRTFLPRQCR